MNGGESVTWAKKPAVPANRKRAVHKKTVERLSSKKYCQKCALQGIRSPIQLFQLNDDEALLMCKNVDCTFMPSSNWESLIVKRHISSISTSLNKKGSSSSLPSSQTSSYSGINSLKSKEPSRSAPQSRSSTPLIGLPSLETQSRKSLSTVTKAQRSLPQQRSLVSPTPSLPETSSEGKERKTLVPIAPFLCGHAHSFSSFETAKLEHKLQPRTAGSYSATSHLSAGQSTSKKASSAGHSVSRALSETHSAPVVGSKRRASSLDSDSYSSSSSSLNSRPTTPAADKSSVNSSKKKIKRIVVPPDTLSKLLDGSLKIEIRKNKSAKGDTIVLKPVSKSGLPAKEEESKASGDSSSNLSQLTDLTTASSLIAAANAFVTNNTSCESEISTNNLEIIPVASLDNFLKSETAQSSDSVALNVPTSANSSTESIKSHIEAINSHLQAISKAIGGSGVSFPLQFGANLFDQLSIKADTCETDKESNLQSTPDFGDNLTNCGNFLKPETPPESSRGNSDSNTIALTSSQESVSWQGDLSHTCVGVEQFTNSQSSYLDSEINLESPELDGRFFNHFMEL